MKSLKLFKNLELDNMSSIYGGKWIDTSKPTYTDSNGCTVTTTDAFDDANGNGRQDEGESGMVCVSVDCPN